MVAQITIPKSLKRALNYNEKKVQQGKAQLILAQNFIKLPDELNFHDKTERFERLMELNERAQTKVIHISLNFPPEEKERMNKDFLIRLADEYMERIGFGKQPYLVYEHHDSGHPHVHVVSTLIQEDGTRINTHHLGKDISDPARKEMEIKYGLISSNKKEFEQKQEKDLAITPQKLQAGKSATQRSIANVLDHVVDRYKYTSLQELNAVLKLYNVRADRGAEEGRIYKNRGLTYVVTDEAGKALTKPIKASAFHNKPTLDYLESRFEKNEEERQHDKQHVRTSVDWVMRSEPQTFGELAALLKKERIDLVVRRNEQGRVYGLTYIDHERKSVFNGSSLGKEYAAKEMSERMKRDVAEEKFSMQQQQKNLPAEKTIVLPKAQEITLDNNNKNALGKRLGKIIEEIVAPEYTDTRDVDRELTEEQRRRRRRRTELDRDFER
ncbi:MAG: relaxase/mobilization nuclease domain-containing protein [Arachidicoccus sp.]|nr:relaxase/mobilization nuclease domain-containing protein [Arachidicoccus sp.]